MDDYIKARALQGLFYWLGFALLFVACQPKMEKQTAYIQNPILSGFYPDPSICQVEGKYYMVNSSFGYFPGLPLFESNDLVTWNQIGHAMTDPTELNLDGYGISEGLFAPAIRYHQGTFHITCTIVDSLTHNFVITAKNPKGPWSSPHHWPAIDGIDPSLFFDGEKAYLIYNSIPPDNESQYDGHRTIRIWEVDLNTLDLIGEEKILVNGGTDWSKNPVWIEGPHILKKHGYYYLLAAQGGTSDQHSEVVFRSENVMGPYQSYDQNPILTQRHLPSDRPSPATCTGHADLVQAPDSSWWGVFLGCRPYTKEGHFNTGRETFMAPVKWENQWPIFDLGGERVKSQYPISWQLDSENENSVETQGSWRDDFKDSVLKGQWVFLRTPQTAWFTLNVGGLELALRPEQISELSSPSFLGVRQKGMNSSATTSISFSTKLPNEKAGLAIFQNRAHYYFFCLSSNEGVPVVQLYKAKEDGMDLIQEEKWKGKGGAILQVVSEKEFYHFNYKNKETDEWISFVQGVDAKFLSTKVAGGFVGAMYALYATSQGQPTDNKATYHWFENKWD